MIIDKHHSQYFLYGAFDWYNYFRDQGPASLRFRSSFPYYISYQSLFTFHTNLGAIFPPQRLSEMGPRSRGDYGMKNSPTKADPAIAIGPSATRNISFSSCQVEKHKYYRAVYNVLKGQKCLCRSTMEQYIMSRQGKRVYTEVLWSSICQ
jgi:hypothetical protein